MRLIVCGDAQVIRWVSVDQSTNSTRSGLTGILVSMPTKIPGTWESLTDMVVSRKIIIAE
jgi:hypothetical protein